MELPSFSVVVPTYRRPAQLAACLDAMAGLDYPRDRFEVIVVDDGGGGQLEDVVEPLGGRLDVTLHRQPNAGPAAARNAGVVRAGGELLAFTDDDCTPDPGWLRALAARMRDDPTRAAGGRTVNELTGNPYSQASQLVSDLVYAHYNADPCNCSFFASNNLAFPARAFRSIGGFDERFRFAEDRELCDRWRSTGRRLVQALDALVHHSHALTLEGFCLQHFGYGRGAFGFHRVRARRGTGRLRNELSFYRGLPPALAEAVVAAAGDRAAVCGLLAVWQAANAAGYAWEAVSSAAHHVRSGS